MESVLTPGEEITRRLIEEAENELVIGDIMEAAKGGCRCDEETWRDHLWYYCYWGPRNKIQDLKYWLQRKVERNVLRDRWYWAFHKRPKLRATWTIEIAQDLCAYHSLDAEEELAKAIMQEIDKEIEKELEQVEYEGPWKTGIFTPYTPLPPVTPLDPNSFIPKSGIRTRYGPSSSLLPVIAKGSEKSPYSDASCSSPRALFWYTETPQALTLLRALWVPSWALMLDPIPPTGLGTREVRDLLETGLCLTPRSRISSSPSIITTLSRRERETWLITLGRKDVPLNLLRND